MRIQNSIKVNKLLAPADNQFGTPVFFLADAPARYNAWDEFVFIVFIELWLRQVMNLVPLFLLLRMRRRRTCIMHVFNRSTTHGGLVVVGSLCRSADAPIAVCRCQWLVLLQCNM